MKRFAYLKKDYINKYFCHELFHHVFILCSYEEIKQVSLVCHLWHDHVQQMRNTLFRRFYDSLGGDSIGRSEKVVDWEGEVKHMLSTYKTDLNMFQYALEVGDERLHDSVVEDGGLVMDVCKFVLEMGGRVAVAELLIHFQKQVSTQTQKSEIVDILDYMCDTLTCVDGDDDDDEAVVYVCLKEFLENGRFIKEVRHLFLMNESQLDLGKMYEWVNSLCGEKKYIEGTKKEVNEFLEMVLADKIDDEFTPHPFYALRKVYTTKRLM